MTTAPPRRDGRRTIAAGLVLLLAYGLASLLLDPSGTLGTDTGAKVATLDHMVDEGTWHPSLPYWAEELDPTGRVHPVHDVHDVDGRWVHVTTLPMLLLARPLYDVGGYRLALLLPMLGAVAAAFAARSLGRRLGDDRTGWQSYWVVGLASPVTIYALDLWEHAPGAACMLAAVALLAGVVDGAPHRWRAVGAGLLLGVAATMRTEAFVYSVTAVGGCALLLASRRQVRHAAEVCAGAVAAFVVPWALNRLLEASLGGTSRTSRATSAASGALGALGDRVQEAVTTLLAPRPTSFGSATASGLLLVGLIAGAVLFARSGRLDRARLFVGAAVAMQLALLAGGLGFVPGMLIAAPLAIAGLLVRVGRLWPYLVGVAVASLPLVWAFQYVGGALPQWAGRYTLTSCLLLVVAGVAALPRLDRLTRLGLVALAVGVTASGVAWTSHRGHEVAQWFDAATERPEDVLIARNGFLVREGGTAIDDRRWLAAVGDDDLDAAVEVVAAAGLETFGVIDEHAASAPRLMGARLVRTDAVPFLDEDLYVHSYVLD